MSRRARSYFKPHEREARDEAVQVVKAVAGGILIHTSVKLVTSQIYTPIGIINILIHTSVKLVTITPRLLLPYRNILIHTSVKLVTGVPCVVAAMAMAF